MVSSKMLTLAVLTVLVTLCYSSPDRTCSNGSWGEWSECKSSCSNTDGHSFDVDTGYWDSGREKMMKIMKLKEKSWTERTECLAKGTCPELQPAAASQGPVPCRNGMSGPHQCRNVDQLSFVNVEDLGYVTPAPGERTKELSDIWGWTDPVTGDEYAIVCLTGGTSFVRVTDPENPVPVAFMYTQTRASLWRDVKTIGNFAYIVSEAAAHGMQVFDLTQLRFRTSLDYFEPTVHYDRFGNAHNIIANEANGYIYVVGATRGNYPDICRGGLHVIDVNDPMNPRFVTCWGNDGYVHDAQCTYYRGPDSRYYGREICLLFNENTFTIVDVEDKSNIRMLSRKGYTGYSYTHQGWFTEDHTVVLLDDEQDEMNNWFDQRTRTYIWDVTDLTNPQLRRTYYSSQTSIDHNLYIRDNLAYQANYQAGFRLLTIDQANYNLAEVAYFDTHPPATTANFNGAWSVYNYFESKNIIVSDIEDGLFVLRPDYAAVQREVESEGVTGEQRRSWAPESERCPEEQEARECQASTQC